MKMKSLSTIASLGALLALPVIVAGCASPHNHAAVRVTEERQYIQLRHLRDTSQPVASKRGAAVAMACGKCKTLWYPTANGPSGGFIGPWGGHLLLCGGGLYHSPLVNPVLDRQEPWHYCPGCKSTITVTGKGKSRKETVKHTCSACGEDSAYCCARTGHGSPTEGMEPKK